MRLIRTLCIAAFVPLLLVPALAGCSGASFYLEIERPRDGAELSRDLVKVIGTVSDAGAAVAVNGVEAHVDAEGFFFAYVELSEGRNLIEAVATLRQEEVRASVTCTSSLRVEVQVTAGKPVHTRAGEEFDIDLRATPRTGYDWEESYDEGLLALVESDFLFDVPLEPVSGSRHFRFKALREGQTEVVFTLIHGQTGPIREQRIFPVSID